MADADDVLLDALLEDVLDPSIIRDAVDEALRLIQRQRPSKTTAIAAVGIEKELRRIERERQGLIAAIASGRTVTGLLEALQALEDRKVVGTGVGARVDRLTPACTAHLYGTRAERTADARRFVASGAR